MLLAIRQLVDKRKTKQNQKKKTHPNGLVGTSDVSNALVDAHTYIAQMFAALSSKRALKDNLLVVHFEQF